MSTVSVLNTDSGLSGKTLVTAEGTQSITGAKTFALNPAAPFAVSAGSANVANLDADKLDGQDGSYYSNAANLTGIIPVLRFGLQNLCDVRLTLTTAVPVTTADVTAAGTLYCAPYKGNLIALYDGASTWKVYNLTEKSLALTLTNANVYDVFLYDNSGTPTLETLIWTNATTRATALTTQDGVLVKSGATTRRYLGTLYASGANTTEDSAANRYLWNYYNQQPRSLGKYNTGNYNYTTATWREAAGSTTHRVNFVIGVAEKTVKLEAVSFASNGTSSVNVGGAIGVDSTTAPTPSSQRNAGGVAVGTSMGLALPSSVETIAAVGFHFASMLEYSAASGTTTWYDNANITGQQAGIGGIVWG